MKKMGIVMTPIPINTHDIGVSNSVLEVVERDLLPFLKALSAASSACPSADRNPTNAHKPPTIIAPTPKYLI